LITASPSPAMPHHRRAQGQTPLSRGPAPMPRRSRMKTLLEQTPSLSNAGLSASVTSQLSLHPSINPTALARGGVAQSSPNVAHPCREPQLGCGGSPVVPLGAAPLHLSAGKVLLCRWWR